MKFKGRKISRLPDGYLVNVWRNHNFRSEELERAIRREFFERFIKGKSRQVAQHI
jgi:uncharacterized protein (DUF3820 family)